MTIHQLPQPCWVLNPPPPDERGDEHHADHAEAVKALREARENDLADKATIVRQMEERCWVIECDGDCGQCIDEEDECYTFHCETRAAAEETMAMWLWAYLGDSELVYCETDRPGGAEVPPLHAQLPAASPATKGATP